MGCWARVFALILFAMLGLAYAAAQEDPLSNVGSNEDLKKVFEDWAMQHGHQYDTAKEKAHRFNIFKYNVKYIQKHNKDSGKSFIMGLNKFSDLTQKEFKKQYVGVAYKGKNRPTHSTLENFRYEDVQAPPTVDWHAKGAVSEAKDQGKCGSCWAFAAISVVEALRWFWTGEMLNLSEQELLDCTPVSYGCGGGWTTNAYQYIVDSGGIHTQADYPYTPQKNACNAKNLNASKVAIDGYDSVPANSEDSLLKAVAMHPVSVLIDGYSIDFQHYRSGVFSGKCGTNLDHAVVIVGYGTDEASGKNYWLVKNSWGAWWGDGGFMKLERLGSGSPYGLCGINMYPTFPVKAWPTTTT